MACCRYHHLLRCFQLHIDAAGKECAASAKHEFGRDEWVFNSAVGRRFRHKTAVACGGILPLGEAVDFVVEQHDVDVDIAAHSVDEVVATDGETIAVARDLPHCHVGIGNFVACGNRCGASVDGVEAISVHVVGEARATTDTGDNGSVARSDSHLSHCLMKDV